MTDNTSQGQEWIRVLEELRAAPDVDVSRDVTGEPGNESADVSASLDPALLRCSPQLSEVGSQWETVEPHVFVSGEFYLTPLSQVVASEPPDFSSSLHSESERALGSELRIIDEAPYTGSGSYAALRLEPGVGNPQIWYADHRHGLWRMDLDYCAYLKVLAVTKGAFDWQHLFTDVPLDAKEFKKTARRVTNMLESLPRIFPDYDYEPLKARWTERVGE